MKKILKKLTKLLAVLCIIGASTATAYAATASFTATYDMHVGIITQKTLKPSKSITVKIMPKSGVSDCTFSIMYGHYGLFGFTGYSVKDGLSTTDTTSTTYKTSEEEQVYVRTWQQKTGDRFTGSLKCSWK